MLSFPCLNEIFLILCFACISMTTPAVDRDDIKNVKYEEYVIEHEISSTQARNAALSTDINAIIVPAGCQECTKEEKHYCMSADLISDHCCCDRRFRENKHETSDGLTTEFLPYIPHTCYFGTQLCTTIAADCNKYARLRTCCCDKYLLPKWKEKFGSGSSISATKTTFALLMLEICLVNILVQIYFVY